MALKCDLSLPGREKKKTVQEITKRRGRPPTHPFIAGIAMNMIQAEEQKPPAQRRIPKVLAYAIREEIGKAIGEHVELKGERPPAESTLVKWIQKARREPSPEDQPWTVASLRQYSVHPDALSTILQLWIWMLDNDGMVMSIREAKWASRFYAAVNAGAKNVEDPLRFLSIFARAYATTEMVAEMIGSAFDMGAAFDATFWTLVTGKPITLELADKIYRRPEPRVYCRTTEREWGESEQLNEKLGNKVALELWAIREKRPAERKGGQQ